ncbi:MAG: hypothetical protein AAGA32_21490 [Pseudomonadota bacterium]
MFLTRRALGALLGEIHCAVASVSAAEEEVVAQGTGIKCSEATGKGHPFRSFIVTAVLEWSPAWEAGVEPGDHLVGEPDRFLEWDRARIMALGHRVGGQSFTQAVDMEGLGVHGMGEIVSPFIGPLPECGWIEEKTAIEDDAAVASARAAIYYAFFDAAFAEIDARHCIRDALGQLRAKRARAATLTCFAEIYQLAKASLGPAEIGTAITDHNQPRLERDRPRAQAAQPQGKAITPTTGHVEEIADLGLRMREVNVESYMRGNRPVWQIVELREFGPFRRSGAHLRDYTLGTRARFDLLLNTLRSGRSSVEIALYPFYAPPRQAARLVRVDLTSTFEDGRCVSDQVELPPMRSGLIWQRLVGFGC